MPTIILKAPDDNWHAREAGSTGNVEFWYSIKGNRELLTLNSVGYVSGFDPDQNLPPVEAGVSNSHFREENPLLITRNSEERSVPRSPFPVPFLMTQSSGLTTVSVF